MLFSIPLVLTLVSGALAGGYGPPKNCLNQASIDTLINGYTYLLEHPGGPDFNSTAEAILSDKFQVLSDSILTLSGRPVSTCAPSQRGPREYHTDEPFYLTAGPACLPKQAGLHR